MLGLWICKGGQASSKSGHRGTSKVWQGGGGEFIKWVYCSLRKSDTAAHGHKLRSLGCDGRAFLLAPAGLADTADDARARSSKGEVTKAMMPNPTNPDHLEM